MAGVSVFSMLIAASVVAGFGTPIGLVLLVRLARDPRVIGDRPISGRLAVAGWTVTIVVGGLGLLTVLCSVHDTWQLLTGDINTSHTHPFGVTRRKGKRARLNARHWRRCASVPA